MADDDRAAADDGGNADAEAQQPASDHGWCQKARLSSGLTGAFISLVMFNLTTQLYSIAFKADLTTMALLQTIVMAWDTVTNR